MRKAKKATIKVRAETLIAFKTDWRLWDLKYIAERSSGNLEDGIIISINNYLKNEDNPEI